MTGGWIEVERELAAWSAGGLVPRLWWRDDDAVEVTPQLERMLAQSAHHAAPLLLAVVPAHATPALARQLADVRLVEPCVHGYAHVNFAPTGEKAQELGDHRPLEVVVADLRRGRERLQELFGDHLLPVLVPPWNRISDRVIAELPKLGFGGLSRFGSSEIVVRAGLREIDTHVDIIDWKGGRVGIAHDRLRRKLAEALATARAGGGSPVGILTHHLVHDATAWSFMDDLLAFVAAHPPLGWVAPRELWRS